MPLNIAFFLAGLILTGMVLKDVFDTVVVPGGGRASLRVAHRLTAGMLPLWKRVRGRRRGLSTAFAPFILVSSFVVWMALLALAFGLMAFAARDHFEPHLRYFSDAVYLSGSALVTVGLSQVNPQGLGRWVILGAGFCGLAVMTMAVTYLLEVQASISRRDTGIIKLNTSAGEPPSALTLLERFAVLRNQAALLHVLEESRDWCATVRQSHSTHPSLIYFQSTGTGAGWPAALGAILDLGLIAEHLIDDDTLYGPAVLLREEGGRMARDLSLLIKVEPLPSDTPIASLQQVASRIGESGYPIRAHTNFEAMAQQRAYYASCVSALADNLGRPMATLIRQG